MQSLTCTVVGDSGVGKTTLLSGFAYQNCPHEYTPTLLDSCTVCRYFDGRLVRVAFHDTVEWGEFMEERRYLYSKSHVILVMFSIASPSSFANIRRRWISEINEFSTNATIVLVGTRSEVRRMDSSDIEKVNFKKGKELANEIGAVMYRECSALREIDIDQLFNDIVTVFNKPKTSPKRKISHSKLFLSCINPLC